MRIPAPLRWVVRRASTVHAALLRSGRAPRALGRNMLLLTTRSRRNGAEVTVPLFHVTVDGKHYVVPSFGGSDDPPGWYRNIEKSPEVFVGAGNERRAAKARMLEPEETVAFWPHLLAIYPPYANYQRRTARWIPIVEIEPLSRP